MTPPAHIVIVPLPVQGHFSSMICLSKRLAEHGLTVTIVNAECVHEKLVKDWSWSAELDIRLQPIHLDCPTSKGTVAAYNEDPVAFMGAAYNLQEAFVSLVNKLLVTEGPISCIVTDFFYYWGLSAAHELGVRHAVYWPASASWCLTEYYLPKLVSSGDLPITEADRLPDSGKLVEYPGLGALRPCDLPTHFTEFIIGLIGPGRLKRAVEQLEGSSWILVNSVYEFEPAVIDALKENMNKNVLCIGPLFPLPGEVEPKLQEEDMACLEWLDGKAPGSVLYVSFGSLAPLSATQIEELAFGLETSGVSFLWVIRQQLLQQMPIDFYEAFIQRNHSKGLVVSWAPQKQVLSHEAIGAFLTHCGWNSVLECISNGKPMLTLPQIYDQTLNSYIVVDKWKAALPLAGIHASDHSAIAKQVVAEIVKTSFVKDILSGPRAVSETMRQAYLSAVSSKGSSMQDLRAFVAGVASIIE